MFGGRFLLHRCSSSVGGDARHDRVGPHVGEPEDREAGVPDVLNERLVRGAHRSERLRFAEGEDLDPALSAENADFEDLDTEPCRVPPFTWTYYPADIAG